MRATIARIAVTAVTACAAVALSVTAPAIAAAAPAGKQDTGKIVALKREAVPQVRLADWYGTATAVAWSSNSGGYVLTRDAGAYRVVLEERSVVVKVIKRAGERAPVQRSTKWHRLATADTPHLPMLGQWVRSAGYNGKQFRLCRVGIPGKGKVCTAYSGIIVPLP